MHTPRKATAKDAELLAISARAADGGAVVVSVVDEQHGGVPPNEVGHPPNITRGTPSSTGYTRGLSSRIALSLWAFFCRAELALPLLFCRRIFRDSNDFDREVTYPPKCEVDA